jgi:2,3-bisphosphoglycerate-independent phosphoglycerate mutase
MYRGIARLLGMDVLGRPADLSEQLEILRESWNDYDYFFLHHKYTDSAGEDGDRARKIKAIENLDAVVPALRALSPDVIAVSGDHSTPSQMAAHSWHPVPALLWSERCGRDDVEQFRARDPPLQGPHGLHARQRRPARQVRSLTSRSLRRA